MFTHTHIHEIGVVRRIAASLTGALIALTGYAIYQDTSAMVVSMMNDTDATHAAPAAETSDDAARIRDFAEQLKQQRAQVSQ